MCPGRVSGRSGGVLRALGRAILGRSAFDYVNCLTGSERYQSESIAAQWARARSDPAVPDGTNTEVPT
jgi:hypothetical protein